MCFDITDSIFQAKLSSKLEDKLEVLICDYPSPAQGVSDTPLTVFRDCSEAVCDLPHALSKSHLKKPDSFLVQVRSLTYDAISKPPHGQQKYCKFATLPITRNHHHQVE